MNIRYVLGTLSLLTAFLSFASVASASTTNLSFDPSYASQPFFYSCDPYKAGFENGKHYQPLATPNCLYTIPSTVLGGSKIIALYKGTPGNSTFVAGDQVIGGSPTLVQENSTTFAGATQDQDYFAVVYGYSSTAEANTFDQSFRTGSSTDINPPTGNFAMIQWKWGGKPASEYNPVVIVPDILNSWQTDSGSVIDPIFLTYKNLIDTLTSNGYVNGQTLFLFPYNWEEPAASTATELQNTIASIKATCGCSHVDIIAHGTGGLIAEQYIESAGYGNDVDQIVFLGTPLQGLPAAYSAWEDGKINFNSPLSDGLAQVFLQAQANTQGYANTFDFVQHAPVQSFKDILPDYDYLYDNSVGERVYPSGYPVNSFLDNLISNLSLLLNRVRITTVLGDDNQGTTPSAYLLGTSTTPPAWPDGQITDTFPDLGDELVPRASIENVVNPVSDVVAADHRDLPTAAEGFIFNSLTNKVASTVANNYPVGCALFITTTPGADLQVTDPNGNHLGKDFTNNVVLSEIPHSLYSGWSVPTEYAVIANPLNGNYQVRTQGTTNTSFTINASDVCNQGVISTSTPANTSPGQLIGFSLGVSTSTNTLTIQPLDINPPVITITSPLNGNSYYQNATTSVAATIVDPENSPIATSTYKINGALINPTQALKFSTLPLGTSTLVVSATDIFGNTAYATSSFRVKPSTAPVVTITSPANGASYTNAQTVPITVSVADAENDVTSTAYKLNGATISTSQASIAMSTLPLGTSTFVASATDASGNISFATSTFTVTQAQVAGTGACAIALNATAKGAVTLAGSTQIKGTNCGVQVNSNASGAVTISGSAKITSNKNCFVGTLNKSGSASISPNQVSCSSAADPFASHAKPAVGACTYTNYSLAGSNKATLNPGVYCGGITVNGSAKLTLNPGIYIINDGDLNIAGSGSVTGDGVSFFMTGSGAGLTLAGSGKLDISAPTSGTMAGFAIFLDPSNANGTPLAATTLAGSGLLTVDGVVYLPRQQFNVAGSAHNAASSFFAVVADTINISGSPTMTFTMPSSSNPIPVPPGL